MLALLSALTMSVIGCRKEETAMPSVHLDTRIVDVVAAGGDYSVGYRIDNPSPDAKLGLSCWDEDWITGISYTDEEICFSVNVNPSETEGREAVINVSYLNISDSIIVRQPASMNGENDMKIGISINSVTSASINATFTPSDKEATYYILTMAKSDYERFESEESLILSETSRLVNEAAGYGLTVEEYLNEYVLKYGDLTKDMPGLQPNTAYFVMAFGMSVTGEPTSGLYKDEATTEEPSGASDLTFELKCDVVGSSATLTVIPSDNEARYYQNYVAGTLLDYLETDIKGVVEYLLQEEIYYGTEAGMSIHEIVDGLSYYGKTEYKADLYNTEENILFAAAISETGDVISEVASESFAMEAITSDNELSVEVTDIGVDKALLKVNATNADPYLIGIAEASKWAGLSDEQVVDAVVFQDDQPYSGSYAAPLGNLKGGTDYVVVVFGYDSEMVTTGVIKKYFCTQSVGSMEDMKFEFMIDDITPFGATVSVSATPVTNMYYWYVKPASMTEQEIKDDIDIIIQQYLSNGMIMSRLDYFKVTGSRGTDRSVITSLDADKDYKAFAVGIEEEQGTYATPMAFSEVFRTRKFEAVDIKAELAVEKYYDCNELIAKGYAFQNYAGKALADLKVNISGNDECANYYYHMVMSDISDAEEYVDAQIFDILFDYGFMNEERKQVFAPYDKVCTLIAVGMDENGNPGKIFRKTVVLTKDGVSDADTFELFAAPAAAKGLQKTGLKKY